MFELYDEKRSNLNAFFILLIQILRYKEKAIL